MTKREKLYNQFEDNTMEQIVPLPEQDVIPSHLVEPGKPWVFPANAPSSEPAYL